MADVTGNEAQQSLEKFSDQEIESRALAVNIARPRAEEKGGGYGRE